MNTKKVNLTITFTNEELMVIREEIEDGKRPAHWDDPTHTDYTVWQNWLQKNPEVGLTKRI